MSMEYTINQSCQSSYRSRRAERIRRKKIQQKKAEIKRKICISAAAILLTVMFAGLTGFSGPSVIKSSSYKYYKAVTVQANDTLWSIASDNVTEEYRSIHAYLKEIKEINDLHSDRIEYGATLILPYYSDLVQ